MATPLQYRAKASAYGELVETSTGSAEKHEFQQLQQSFTALADNAQWLADHDQNTVHASDEDRSKHVVVAAIADKAAGLAPRQDRTDDVPAADDEELVLRCLGAALIMQWNTLPTKLQKELFDKAGAMKAGVMKTGAMGPLSETAALRGQIARFLHSHKNGEDAAT
jgi:hypothetical protein